MDDIKIIEGEHLSDNIPEFGPGDLVRVVTAIKRGDRERTHRFEGVVIKIRGSGTGKTFTLRKVTQGVGVEKVYPMNSPIIKSSKASPRNSRRSLFFLPALR